MTWLRGTLAAVLFVVAVHAHAEIGRAFRTFDRELGDGQAAIRAIPPGASIVRPDGAPNKLRPFVWPVLDHFAAYAAAHTLGASPGFFDAPFMLVRMRPDASPTPYGALAVTPEKTLRYEPRSPTVPDYLLFHTQQPSPPTIAILNGGAKHFRLQRRTGGLNIYVLAGESAPAR